MISLDVKEVASAIEDGRSFCTNPDTFLEARTRLGLEVQDDDPYAPLVKTGCGGKED